MVELSLKAMVADVPWALSPAPDLLYRALLLAGSVGLRLWEWRGKPLVCQCCTGYISSRSLARLKVNHLKVLAPCKNYFGEPGEQ